VHTSTGNLADALEAVKPTAVATRRQRQASRGEAERVVEWSVVPTSGDRVTGRYGHTAVVHENFIYFFGGDGTSKRLNTVVRFDTEANTLAEVPTKGDRPSPRSGNSAVIWDSCMYVFGGRDGNNHYDDIYQLKLSNRRWEKIEPATDMRCPARYRHSSVVHNGKMFAFGGEIGGENGHCYRDLYVFNFERRTWKLVKTTGELPPARSAHSAVVHIAADGVPYLIIYGGRNKDKSQYFRDMYRCNLNTKVWSQLIGATGDTPPATYDHACAYYRNSFFVWGGYGSEGHEMGPGTGAKRQDTLYEYSIDFNRWIVVETLGESPSARLGHTLNCLRGRLFLFGGWDRNGYCNDLNVLRLDDYIMDVRGLLLDPHGTSDVVFAIENQVIHAHSPMLFARCPKLCEKVLAEGRWQDQSEGLHRRVCHYRVQDFAYEAFFDFMMFVYTGTLQFSDKYMVDVWVLAKTYDLKRAMGLCIQAMMKNLDNDNVLFVLQSAHRSKIAPIRAYCLEHIAKNFECVVQSQSIRELDSDVLVELLRLQTAAGREAVAAQKSPRRLSDLNEFEKIPEDTLREDFLQLVASPTHSDVTFLVGKERIPAHSCLISRCPAFSVMFNAAFREGREKVVELKDVSPKTFLAFLAYTYGTFVSIGSLTDALELLSLADRFLLEPLKDLCGRYITESSGTPMGLLNHHNIWTVLEIADQCRLDDLRKASVDYIARNFHAVCKSHNLKRFDANTLIDIIQRHAQFCTNYPVNTSIGKDK
jgi:N-acetylneuraminic acid mutarotase